MTVTYESDTTHSINSNDKAGRVVRVTGPCRRREFPWVVPNCSTRCMRTSRRLGQDADLEVAQHLGETWCAASPCSPPTVWCGSGHRHRRVDLSLPVGDGVQAWCHAGQCLDEPGYGRDYEHWSIHRRPPPVFDSRPAPRDSETGLKVVDLLTPYVRAARRPVRRRRRRQDRADPGDDQPHRP